jgi:hypothetical protein
LQPNCQPTTRHSAASDITSQHCQEQLTYDALRILDFNADALGAIDAEMQELAHAGKIAQGRSIARKRSHAALRLQEPFVLTSINDNRG